MRRIKVFILCVAAIQGLALHVQASTLTVSSTNWMDVIGRSRDGDTIRFSPGKYTILTDVTIPARTYIGARGAIFSGAHKLNLTGSDVSGFTFEGVDVRFTGAESNFHGNTFTGASSIDVGESSNLRIAQNTFKSTRNYCLSGYPGSNVVVEYNNVDLRNAVTGGPDSNGEEWLHFVSGASGISVSNNYIIGNTLRWAIELQSGMQNLKVDNNYITAQAGSAISCATGGDATAPYAHQGKNIDISGNVLLNAHAPDIQDCALEIMGDAGIIIHDNYFNGYGTGILNGTGGQANRSAVTHNNIIVYRDAAYNKEQFLWTVPDLISTGDKVYKVGAPSIPAPPAAPPKEEDPTTLPTSGMAAPPQPTTQPAQAAAAASVATPATPFAASAVPRAHSISLTWLPQQAPMFVEIRPTQGALTMGWETAAHVPPGASMALVSTYHGQPLNAVALQTWKYDVRLTSGLLTQSITVQCLATDASGSTTQPTTAPALQQDIAQLAADEARLAADLSRLQQHVADGK